MLLFTTRHSAYAIDPGLGMIMQLPGGTPCGLRPGVWHAMTYDRQPVAGEPFRCLVHPRGSAGLLSGLRTSPVEWVGPEPPLPAYAEIRTAG